MWYFACDYSEGAFPEILEKLAQINLEQLPGYGEDHYCQQAAKLIRTLCQAPDAAVHFLVGGTQTNATVISAALRAHQGVLCADTGHINTHETGAVEARGHKVLGLPPRAGKISAKQIEQAVLAHQQDASREHLVQPKMVYLSQPTEFGALYSKKELCQISQVCRKYGLYLFVDGARLGYALAAEACDVALADLAALCDVFYIGGTKLGTLFGEALVISHAGLQTDFRYHIKQNGGMLAKGWLLGVQFLTLLAEDRYLIAARRAVKQALRIRKAFANRGYLPYVDSPTNQQFIILPEKQRLEIEKEFVLTWFGETKTGESIMRFCTSWATSEQAVQALEEKIAALPLKE